MSILMKKVTSSNIREIGYDDRKNELHVTFIGPNAVVYVYLDVPRKVHKKLMTADSVGGFLNQKIKGQFKFEKRDIVAIDY